MLPARRLLILLMGLAVLGGCAGTDPIGEVKRIFQKKGQPELAAGIRNYDDGRYKQATVNFQSAISAGLTDADEVTANKYLAFMHCVGGRERQCRAHFTRALEINPDFELEPAEAGHPIWGPVFRNIKSRKR